MNIIFAKRGLNTPELESKYGESHFVATSFAMATKLVELANRTGDTLDSVAVDGYDYEGNALIANISQNLMESLVHKGSRIDSPFLNLHSYTGALHGFILTHELLNTLAALGDKIPKPKHETQLHSLYGIREYFATTLLTAIDCQQVLYRRDVRETPKRLSMEALPAVSTVVDPQTPSNKVGWLALMGESYNEMVDTYNRLAEFTDSLLHNLNLLSSLHETWRDDLTRVTGQHESLKARCKELERRLKEANVAMP